MSVELAAKEASMDDNITGLGPPVVTNDGHVANEHAVF